MVSALRHREVRLCQDVLAVLGGAAARLPTWSLAEVEALGTTTGLLPLAGSLGLFDDVTPDVAACVSAARAQAAAQVARCREVTPRVVGALTDAGVPGVVVGGAALVSDVWPEPDRRPVTDIDVVVPPHLRERATSLVVGALGTDSTIIDVLGGSSVRLHGYLVDGCAIEPATFDHAALTTYVLAGLSSAVVRREVRSLNVVDFWWCTQQDLDWVRVTDLMAHTDPRLTAPALWLVHRLLPTVLPEGLLASQLARLPRRGRDVLHRHHAVDVLLDPAERTSLTWRVAFTETLRERKAVVRDLVRRAPARR